MHSTVVLLFLQVPAKYMTYQNLIKVYHIVRNNDRGTLGQIHKNYFTFGLNWYIMLFKKRKTYSSWTFISSNLPNFRFKDFRISAVLHFVSQWLGLGETKLLHFSLSRLFDALVILRYDLYQSMADTLRYVTILKFIYRILKPISFEILQNISSIFDL